VTNTRRVNVGKRHPTAYKAIIVLSAEVETAPPRSALTRFWLSR
jgi:hypothetical protein